MEQNKIGKYLIYAFGEIILVIIGILIALNLNKQSEQKQTEAKIDAIMVDVLDELGDNIARTNRLIKQYSLKDSVLYLILNNKLTYDDYTNPKIPQIFHVTTNYNTVEVNRIAFDILLPNIDAMPERYNDIVKKLTVLHTVRKNVVDTWNEKVTNFVYETISKYSANYDWPSFIGPLRENKGKIDYMLNDFKYKNEAYDYRLLGIQNHLNGVFIYRRDAVDLYQKLATLLDKPTIHESFKIDEDMAELFVGEWKDSDSDRKIKITFENNRMSTQVLGSSRIRDIQILSSKKLTSKTVINVVIITSYRTLIFEKDTLEVKTKRSSIKYLKVND